MYRGKVVLFGTVQVYTGQDEPLDPPSPRVQALCVYLSLHQGQPLDRRRLAFLIWPNVPEQAARRNLRQYLHRLRHYFRPIDPEGSLIVTDGSTVTFDPQHFLWIDVQIFREHVQRAENDDGPGQLAALRAAVDLYRGDLAPNIYDDWCQQEREYYRQQYERALHLLISLYETSYRLDEAIYWAERALQVNPLQETLYRTLMRLYVATGDRARALEVYERCRRVLQEALGASPLPETERLFQEIQAGEPTLSFPSLASSAPPASPPPIPSSAPEPASASPPRRSHPSPPLVGRETDLQWLHQIVNARPHQGALIIVEGEAGIGKTRLLSEWLTQLPAHFRVMTTEAGEFEHIIPYHPFKSLLQEHETSISWDTLPYRERWEWAIAYLLPQRRQPTTQPLTRPGAPPVDHWVILEGLESLLRALAEHTPLVIWIDEAHWADHPTWQAIAYLAQRLTPQVPFYLVLTLRGEDIAEPNRGIWRRLLRAAFTHHRALARLGRKETFTLARALLGPNVDLPTLRRLYTLTEGNPLFVIETARALALVPERRLWFQTSRGADFSLPERVRHVIESRLDVLPEAHRSLLQVAAVAGRTFNVPQVAHLAEVEEATLLRALDEWLQRGLVSETHHGYTFSHTLVWQVVYNELSTARRRWLHRRMAEWLERHDDTSAATIAYHYAASDQPYRALPFFIRAAEDALRVRSYHEARSCALEVLRIWRHHPPGGPEEDAARVDVNLHLAQAYNLSGLTDEALPLLEETRRLAERLGDPARLAQVLLRLAQTFWHRGNPQAAQDHARAALRWAQTAEDKNTHAAALRMLGRTAIVLSAFDDAVMVLRRHLEEVDGDDPRQVVVWSYLGVAWARLGHWSHAFEAAQRAVTLAEMQPSTSNQALAYMHHAFVHAERRQWAQAEALARQALERIGDLPFTPVYFMARAVGAYARGMLGDKEEAVATLHQVLQRARSENYRVLTYLPHYFLAQIHYHHQTYREALQAVRQAHTLAQQAGDRWAVAVTLRLEADTLSAMPHPDWPAIEARLVRSVTILRQVRARPDLARTYLSLRRLYDRAARVAWAVDCHFRAVTLFEELGMIEELRAAQGQARRSSRPSQSALTAPLTGPAWLRGETSPSHAAPTDG